MPRRGEVPEMRAGARTSALRSRSLIRPITHWFALSSPVWIVILVLIGFTWRLAWAWLIPHDQAPDEPGHMRFIAFLLREKHLPTLAESGPATTSAYAATSPFPYLPYVVVAGLFSLRLDQDLLALRLLSVIMGALVIGIAALNSRMLFRDEPLLVIGIPAFLAVHPQFTFLQSYVTADAVTILASSILVLWWTKLWFDGPSWKNTLILALIVGFVVLTKANALALLPATGLLWAWSVYRARLAPAEIAVRASVAFLVIASLAGSYYVRTWFEFRGDLTGARTMIEISEQQWPDWALTALPFTVGDVLRYLRTSFIAWWAFFGNLEHILPRPVYVGLGLLVLASMFGLLRMASRQARLEMPAGLLMTYTVAFATIVALSVVYALNYANIANGKYWYPAMIPAVSLLFAGCVALPVGTRRFWPLLLVSLGLFLGLWSYFGLLWPLYIRG